MSVHSVGMTSKRLVRVSSRATVHTLSRTKRAKESLLGLEIARAHVEGVGVIGRNELSLPAANGAGSMKLRPFF